MDLIEEWFTELVSVATGLSGVLTGAIRVLAEAMEDVAFTKVPKRKKSKKSRNREKDKSSKNKKN